MSHTELIGLAKMNSFLVLVILNSKLDCFEMNNDFEIEK